ncbi:MAG TPA: hypothetical protein VF048_04620 [Gemmatimonadaceae bacterium]
MLRLETSARERSRWFRPLGLMAIGVVTLALGSAPAGAQTSVLYGCYVPNSGTVYRIKGAGLPDECRSPQHVQFTWSLQGPVGPQGPAGPQGAEGAQGPAGGLSGHQVVTSRINSPPGVWIGHAVDCPAGKLVIGGGYVVEGATSGVQWSIASSRPATDPFNPTRWSRWAVEAHHDQATQQFLVVYAVCSTAN